MSRRAGKKIGAAREWPVLGVGSDHAYTDGTLGVHGAAAPPSITQAGPSTCAELALGLASYHHHEPSQ